MSKLTPNKFKCLVQKENISLNLRPFGFEATATTTTITRYVLPDTNLQGSVNLVRHCPLPLYINICTVEPMPALDFARQSPKLDYFMPNFGVQRLTRVVETLVRF